VDRNEQRRLDARWLARRSLPLQEGWPHAGSLRAQAGLRLGLAPAIVCQTASN
jgi:hypothetical protein